MSTTLAGAALSIFMGVSTTFGGIESASYNMTYWPTMENCKKAVDDEILSMSPYFKFKAVTDLKPGEYGKSAERGRATVTFVCRPQG